MPLICACSLDASIITATCGPVIRAHILKPLTDHSGLKKRAPIPWTDDMQKAFNKMCALIAADALAAYPDHKNGLMSTLMHLIFN